MAAGIDPDDFSSGSLETWWTFVDPLTDCSYAFEGAGTANARLNITVPSGTSHAGVANAPRMEQDASDTDFDIEAKVDVLLDQTSGQYAGIGVSTSGDDVRINAYSYNGDDYVETIQAETSLAETTPALTSPFWFRIDRSGDTWTTYYSTNGTGWTQHHQWTYAATVSKVYVSCGNFDLAGTPADPEHIVKFDYFWERSDIISPEDPVTSRRVLVR